MRLEGLNHITAITGDAPGNVDFYTGVLGLRLVAKTVNQDDSTVYHLFYADEDGDAGSDITFFEYPGATRGRVGPGCAYRVLWRVPSSDSLAFWAERLAELEVERTVAADGGVVFADREGLEHELLVEDVPDSPQRARHPDIPLEHALIGFAGVRVHSLREAMSMRLLEDVLGATRRDEGTLELRGERRGATISFDEPPAGSRHVQGAGSIHHIAWGTTVAEHPRWHEHLAGAGVPTTPIIDRHFFHSIYFREPGGILYEIADDAPGFAMDGPLSEMGRTVILPPWLEQHRAAIEARLTPLPDPRAGWLALDQPS
ncbi:MAG TPA: VOC family protein [Solirubrobacteraceae bacterium]|jgi:glyoxalase family protein|nr:VOC family protein [Solirubrobacteraceae bacterium]